jgi:co-chaperonin GroES (HSP10)
MTLKPIRKNIIFQFCDPVGSINFIPQTKSGIILTDNHQYKEAHTVKWGRLVSCGPEVSSEISESKYILIEPGKWTENFKLDGEKFWKTEEDFILAVTNEEINTYRY